MEQAHKTNGQQSIYRPRHASPKPQILTKSLKSTTYISLVRSILEFGYIVWEPYISQDITRVEQIKCVLLDSLSVTTEPALKDL